MCPGSRASKRLEVLIIESGSFFVRLYFRFCVCVCVILFDLGFLRFILCRLGSVQSQAWLIRLCVGVRMCLSMVNVAKLEDVLLLLRCEVEIEQDPSVTHRVRLCHIGSHTHKYVHIYWTLRNKSELKKKGSMCRYPFSRRLQDSSAPLSERNIYPV